MAGGSLDPNGVWLYGEDDARDTFSELLNIGQDSVSDAVAADRARLTAIETAAVTGAVTSGVMTAATGWSITSAVGRRKSGLAFIEVLFIRTGADIAVPSVGNVGDTLMGTFNAGWVPAGGMTYPGVSRDGRISAFVVYSSGVQIVWTTGGSTPIVANDPFRVTAVYPLG